MIMHSESVSSVQIRVRSGRFGRRSVSVTCPFQFLLLTASRFGIIVRFRSFGRWAGWESPSGSSSCRIIEELDRVTHNPLVRGIAVCVDSHDADDRSGYFSRNEKTYIISSGTQTP